MVDNRHLESHDIAITQRKIIRFDKIWYTTAFLELSDSQMAKYEHF